jgi:branched-chain amino acid aminotransferase
MRAQVDDIEMMAPPPSIDLDPERIEFGRIFSPLWLTCRYANGAWGEPRIESVGSIDLHPAAIVFHYGQAIFEGLKAYKWADGSVHLFRPEQNARRFRDSAERMALPPVDEKIFVDGIRDLVGRQRDWIPHFPGSLYIRPTMIGTEPCIGVRPSDEVLFYVLTLPSGAYFPKAAGVTGTQMVPVYVTTRVGRAAPGGTGNVKAAANYAVTLKVIGDAKKKGCAQVLFLDARGQGHIEEMGGMNIFFVSGGKLVTPFLHDTVLPGITRDSVLHLAPRLGFEVEEADISFDALVDRIQKGEVTEAFACGTAAVIAGIDTFLLDDGRKISVGSGKCGEVTDTLYQHLVDIQYGKRPDPFGWMVEV